MNGPQCERDCVNELNEAGYPAIRMAASGGGGEHDLPDVFFKAGDYYIGAEMKATSDDYAYIQADELEALRTFCDDWGAIPIALSRWSQDTDFYTQPIETASDGMMTDGGALSLRRDRRGRYFELERYCAILERS